VFERFPAGSKCYVESRVRLRATATVHLAEREVAKHGRKYLTTSDGVRWRCVEGQPGILVREDIEVYAPPMKMAPECLLFAGDAVVRDRLVREQSERWLDRELRARGDQIEEAINGEDPTKAQEIARRFVERLIETGKADWVALAGRMLPARHQMDAYDLAFVLGVSTPVQTP